MELYYDGRVEVQLTYDWQSRFGEVPEGMTVCLARDGDSITTVDVSNEVHAYTARLLPGLYRMMTFNKTYYEFDGVLRFINRQSHDQLYAKSFTWQQNESGVWDEDRTYLEEPDPIGVAVDTFLVPATQDDLTFYDYRQHYEGDTLVIERPEVVLPMTTRLYVRVKVRGLSYMDDVQGFVSGLSDGFLMSHTWRHENVGAVKLLGYTAHAVQGEPNTAWLTFDVATFGLPHGKERPSQRTENTCLLQLCFTLVDGRRHYVNYNVGRIIHYMKDDEELFTRDDVTVPLEIVIDPVELPYAQPTGTGAFEAEVADWEDTETIDVGF